MRKKKDEKKQKWKAKWEQGMKRKFIKKDQAKKFYPRKPPSN